MMGMGLATSCAVGVPGGLPVTAGLVLDLDPSKGITIATGVSQWNDSSGVGDANHNAVQGTGALQPTFQASNATYNNKPTVTFSGSQLLLTGTWATGITPPFTVYFAGHTTSGAGADAIMAGTVSITITDASGTNLSAVEGGSLAAGVGTLNTANVTYFIVDGASSSIGRSKITPNASGSTGAGSTDNRLGIGNFSGGGANALNGPMARLLIYTGHHTVPQLTAVMQYLGTLYGVAIGA